MSARSTCSTSPRETSSPAIAAVEAGGVSGISSAGIMAWAFVLELESAFPPAIALAQRSAHSHLLAPDSTARAAKRRDSRTRRAANQAQRSADWPLPQVARALRN